jgi:predicted DNA-binding transcriptional regulator AlpA
MTDINDHPHAIESARKCNISDDHESLAALLMSIPTFCQRAGISRSMAYLEIKAGRLRPRKCGRRTLIPVAEVQRWIDALPVFEPEPFAVPESGDPSVPTAITQPRNAR